MSAAQNIAHPRPRFIAGSQGGVRASPAWFQRSEAIMGTAIQVELWSEDRAQAEAAMAAVIDEMHRIDRTMSPHKASSELSCINREAAVRPVPLSDEMFGLLQRAIHFSALSGGAFDITFASAGPVVIQLAGVSPSDETLDAARALIGWRGLQLDAATRSVRFARDGMRIDLGGFAKGHAVDNGVAILRRRGIAHGMVSAGGDSHVLGDRRGRPWTIGVR
ncbi:thiamine biosynthesis protein ApbE, partial [Pelomonas sp. HMWF004]